MAAGLTVEAIKLGQEAWAIGVFSPCSGNTRAPPQFLRYAINTAQGFGEVEMIDEDDVKSRFPSFMELPEPFASGWPRVAKIKNSSLYGIGAGWNNKVIDRATHLAVAIRAAIGRNEKFQDDQLNDLCDQASRKIQEKIKQEENARKREIKEENRIKKESRRRQGRSQRSSHKSHRTERTKRRRHSRSDASCEALSKKNWCQLAKAFIETTRQILEREERRKDKRHHKRSRGESRHSSRPHRPKRSTSTERRKDKRHHKRRRGESRHSSRPHSFARPGRWRNGRTNGAEPVRHWLPDSAARDSDTSHQ